MAPTKHKQPSPLPPKNAISRASGQKDGLKVFTSNGKKAIPLTRPPPTYSSNDTDRLSGLSGDSQAKLAADKLGRDLEAMGYKLNCQSFITRGSSIDENGVVERYATPKNNDKNNTPSKKTKKNKLKNAQLSALSSSSSSSSGEGGSSCDKSDDENDSSDGDSSSDSDDSSSSSSSSDTGSNTGIPITPIATSKARDDLSKSNSSTVLQKVLNKKKKPKLLAPSSSTASSSAAGSRPSVVEITKIPMEDNDDKGSKNSVSTVSLNTSIFMYPQTKTAEESNSNNNPDAIKESENLVVTKGSKGSRGSSKISKGSKDSGNDESDRDGKDALVTDGPTKKKQATELANADVQGGQAYKNNIKTASSNARDSKIAEEDDDEEERDEKEEIIPDTEKENAEHGEEQQERKKNRGRQLSTRRSESPEKPTRRSKSPEKPTRRSKSPEKSTRRSKSPEKSNRRSKSPEKLTRKEPVEDKESGIQTKSDKRTHHTLQESDFIKEKKRLDSDDGQKEGPTQTKDRSSRNKVADKDNTRTMDKSGSRSKSPEKENETELLESSVSAIEAASDKSTMREEDAAEDKRRDCNRIQKEQPKKTEDTSDDKKQADCDRKKIIEKDEEETTDKDTKIPAGKEKRITEKNTGNRAMSEKGKTDKSSRDKEVMCSDTEKIPTVELHVPETIVAGKQKTSEKKAMANKNADAIEAGKGTAIKKQRGRERERAQSPSNSNHGCESLSTASLNEEEEVERVEIDGMSVLAQPVTTVQKQPEPKPSSPKKRPVMSRLWRRKPRQQQPRHEKNNQLPGNPKIKPTDKQGAGLIVEESVEIPKKRKLFGHLFQKRGGGFVGCDQENTEEERITPSQVRIIEIEHENCVEVELIADSGLSPRNWINDNRHIELDPMAMPMGEFVTFDDSAASKPRARSRSRSRSRSRPRSRSQTSSMKEREICDIKDLSEEATKEVVKEFAKEFARELAAKNHANNGSKTQPTNKDNQASKLVVEPVARQGSTPLATTIGDLLATLTGTKSAKEVLSSSKAAAVQKLMASEMTDLGMSIEKVRVQSEATRETAEFCRNADCLPVHAQHALEEFYNSKRIQELCSKGPISRPNVEAVHDHQQRLSRNCYDETNQTAMNLIQSTTVGEVKRRTEVNGKPGPPRRNSATEVPLTNADPKQKSPSPVPFVQITNPRKLLNRLTSPTTLLAPEPDDFTFALSGGQSESFDWYKSDGKYFQLQSGGHNRPPQNSSKLPMRAYVTKQGPKRVVRAPSPVRNQRAEFIGKAPAPQQTQQVAPRKTLNRNFLSSMTSDDDDDDTEGPSTSDKEQSVLSAMVIEVPQKTKYPTIINDKNCSSPKHMKRSTSRERNGMYHKKSDGKNRPSVPEYINPKQSNGQPIPTKRDLRIAGKSPHHQMMSSSSKPSKQRPQNNNHKRFVSPNKEAVKKFAQDWAQLGDAHQVLEHVMSTMGGNGGENQSTGTLDEAERLLATGESHLGDVEKALATLKKHAKNMGVRETDLLIATVKSYDSGAFSELSFTMGEEFMDVLNSYLKFRK